MFLFVSTLSAAWPAFAQDTDGVVRDVEVKVIRPIDLPKPQESTIPSVLSGDAPLPRAPNISDVVEARDTVFERIVQIVAIYPPGKFQRDKLLARGHAVLISAKKDRSDPVLVTALHWVEGAEAVYAVPWNAHQKEAGGNLPRVQVTTISSALTHNSAKSFLKHEKKRIALTLHDPDPHRNLTTLRLIPDRKGKVTLPTWLKVPQTGLKFFDISKHSATQIFGLSPLIGPNARQTAIMSTHQAELVYYLQCDFPAILGAPLFGPDGGIIGMTAMRNPMHPESTLVIPPLALRKYVERVQGISTPEAPAKK